MVLPVNGTREALFSFVQRRSTPNLLAWLPTLVLMPNPFYQIYEGAALLAGAEPRFSTAPQRMRICPTWTQSTRRPGAAARCCSFALPATPQAP